MTKHLRLNVALQIRQSGIIPLYYNPDVEICKKVITACYRGGLKVFEFTNRGDFAHEVFSELSKWAAVNYPDLILGAGTIIDPATSALYIQSGASFVVAPLLNEEMASICNRRKVLWIPGCATPSEISRAESLGAEVIKIYPASLVGGPAFIKAIKGTSPWTQLMPSGGVSPTPENLKEWFEAGVFCVGLGSKLITSEIIQNSDYKALEAKVAELVGIVSEFSDQRDF